MDMHVFETSRHASPRHVHHTPRRARSLPALRLPFPRLRPSIPLSGSRAPCRCCTGSCTAPPQASPISSRSISRPPLRPLHRSKPLMLSLTSCLPAIPPVPTLRFHVPRRDRSFVPPSLRIRATLRFVFAMARRHEGVRPSPGSPPPPWCCFSTSHPYASSWALTARSSRPPARRSCVRRTLLGDVGMGVTRCGGGAGARGCASLLAAPRRPSSRPPLSTHKRRFTQYWSFHSPLQDPQRCVGECVIETLMSQRHKLFFWSCQIGSLR
ncbi:hypothetical protein MSAN_02001700 [Mycena sanguinolenta]|uniref:Uncharacterized protein n=1 Tax=Mycena sanguinolenta TaxID=230812 RepID=A0A8H6XLT9_9AGAR|nr:hypothetical protein MSAN_02001700 [Mycena sanguinolenta]